MEEVEVCDSLLQVGEANSKKETQHMATQKVGTEDSESGDGASVYKPRSDGIHPQKET